jgi:hypothetical protein
MRTDADELQRWVEEIAEADRFATRLRAFADLRARS